MKTVVVIIQLMVSLAFLSAGFAKAYTPYEQLITEMPWVEGFSPLQVQMISILELLGALGLLLPVVIRQISKYLVVVAGFWLGTIMIGAIVTHMTRGEMIDLVAPLILGALSIYIALYRRKELLKS